MRLSDFLLNTRDNIKQAVGGLAGRLMPEQVVIAPIQQAENGGVDVQRTLELALAQPKTFGQRLGGRTVNVDIETLNPETNQMEVNRISKFQPGLFNDISAGAKENFVTGFAAPNWEQDKTADGRQKGLGYRFGEGLGTFARFAESPLGRSLLMAGITAGAGGSGLEALAYGSGAGLLNQQARMKDKMYRNELEKMGFDTSTIRGYVGDDTFNKIYQSKQLQDNAEYRNALLASNQKNQELANEIAKEKFSYQKVSDAADRALKSRELDIKEYQALNEGNKKGQEYENPKIILNNVEQLWRKTPQGRAIKGTSKGKAYQTGIANALGMNNNDVSAYMAIAESMVTPLARQIAQEKGNVSDRDIARARAMLPQVTDSYEQGMAKINAVRKLLNDLEQGDTSNAIQTQTTTNEGWAF